MRIELTATCLLAGSLALALTSPAPAPRRPSDGRWQFFCGAIDHDHPTAEGADFCRSLRSRVRFSVFRR